MNVFRHTLSVFATLFIGSVASAHVSLSTPNGGETLNAGSTVSINWSILIAHSQQNWDLEYSLTGPTGPWIALVTDLAPGSTASGSQHSFLWTVPDTPSNKVRVRVTMDNLGVDYQDLSNANITIIGTSTTDCNANGTLDSDDIATGASLDLDNDGLPDECQTLFGNKAGVSWSLGGSQTLSVNMGPAFASSLYLIAGSFSGSSPGTPFGSLIVPLNFDSYTLFTLTNANTPTLAGTFGVLDAVGKASGIITLLAGATDPALIGLTVRHAAAIFGGAPGNDAVTNWMPLTIAP